MILENFFLILVIKKNSESVLRAPKSALRSPCTSKSHLPDFHFLTTKPSLSISITLNNFQSNYHRKQNRTAPPRMQKHAVYVTPHLTGNSRNTFACATQLYFVESWATVQGDRGVLHLRSCSTHSHVIPRIARKLSSNNWIASKKKAENNDAHWTI